MADPKTIYLAPACCYEKGSYEGRCWCEDDVWPCNDCPDKSKVRVPRYRLAGYVEMDPNPETG
jgi:hypothetical protein